MRLVLALGAACGDADLGDGATTSSGATSSTAVTTSATGATSTGSGDVGPLAFGDLSDRALREEEAWSAQIEVSGGPTRVFADDLPPGATWDETSRTLRFRPDFTQAGRYLVALTAVRGDETLDGMLALEVSDDVTPPAPEIVSTETVDGCQRLRLRQTTDAFLGSPGDTGETFDAILVVPEDTAAPVIVELHGFGGGPNGSAGCATSFRLFPHDPKNTYWWGYADSLPGASPPTTGRVHDYTQRRTLALLAWIFATYPEADRERVFVRGGSMGGAGALTMGLLHGRHFAGIDATLAQAIPRNHRPSRINQLRTLWGTPEVDLPDDESDGTWDHMDLTRALTSDAEARNQFLFVKHGKDDPTIHFGAALTPSPLTGKSFYEVLEEERVGHYAVWDEGAHGPPDPVMGDAWWDRGWSRISDAESFLRRDLPFPAFTSFSENDDPGDGGGNGKVRFSAESGFAADVATPGDTGWNGDIAGALNRFLRWDATATVDTRARLEIPVRHVDGEGADAPADGYPSIDDRYDGAAAPTVSITPRRVRRFQCLPGEAIAWTFGERTGTATASADGSVTVPDLPVTTAWTTLVLERASH